MPAVPHPAAPDPAGPYPDVPHKRHDAPYLACRAQPCLDLPHPDRPYRTVPA